MDAWTLLRRRLASTPGSPFVTFVDGPDRVELSATSLENGAAKVANALRDEFELDPGSTIALLLPPHWQRSVWVAGAWGAECAITDDPSQADLLVTSLRHAQHALSLGAREVAVVSLHPFGLPEGNPPSGAIDATTVVRQQPDAFLLPLPSASSIAWVRGGAEVSQAQALQDACNLAESWGVAEGGRLLVPADTEAPDAWTAVFALPLVANASVVLTTAGSDLELVGQQEGVTARITP